MDGLAIRVLSQDWHTRYHLARIDKIHQPSERELVLTLRSKSGTSRIMLSAHRSYARAHELLTVRPANPEEPPMFCMRMRKHLEGGRIIKVRQQGYDRVLELLIENQNEIGDTVQFVLILEIMGKHSNLILCEAKGSEEPARILDSVVHVTHDMSRVRQVLPGLPYTPPPAQDKMDVIHLDGKKLEEMRVHELADKALNRALMNKIAGLGMPTVIEVLSRTGLDRRDPSFPGLLATTIKGIFETALEHREQASIGLDELGRPAAAAPFHLTSFNSFKPANNLDEALDTVFHAALTHAAVSHRAGNLLRRVDNLLDHLRGKLVKLQQLQQEAQNHDDLRIRGELLTTYGYTLQKGLTKVELPNFYDDEKPLSIELDPALTPMENAQKYFKQSSRKKRALPILKQELEATHGDIEYLETALVHLQDVSETNLSAIEQELVSQGFLTLLQKRKEQKGKDKKRKKETQGPGQPDSYVSSDGFLIRVGRNNLQNDRLTLRQAQPTDLWFHVKDQPGSHVVIQTDQRPTPEQTIEEAALLAAYFSKARDSGNVAVDYTLIKQVWKANGARPGHVLYEGQKTLYVTPDRTLLEPLLQKRVNS